MGFDAIVVGARCAGSPTAMLLARAGHRVLLLDRGEFPSDTISTHVIHQPGVAALARWGLLEQLRATGCPPLRHARYQVGDVRLAGCGRGVAGQRAGYAPRRFVLDDLLARAAVAAGAELREKCRVTGLVRDEDGRVVGVRGEHRGVEFTERAALVVGADGMRSSVAAHAGAAFTTWDERLSCAYYSYWTGVPADLEIYEEPGSWVAATPTHGHATLVLTYFPQSRFRAVRADARRAHLQRVRDTAPELFERLQGGEQVERLRGSGDQQNFFREATGPGWVLVGDAGHHKDSITARGISDAFGQAESLARHISGELDSPSRLDAALGGFAAERDGALRPGYEATLSVARMVPPNEHRMALLRAIQRDEELTSIYFDAFAGATDITALYTPRLRELLAEGLG
ncbi:FAD-dependent oxidoreductase [Saccharopolyspora flava]|uniref:Dehydrogenase (Flavoprotein) n=1 Tax=Saccharopolyspora flava TaxID=95161 RepID=A0A1I6PK55_9PSEU|nr:NAD(P)/FAD-dependent oxidoreductase [Saccharopolyspora flava]SFS40556.1 Dehydrogenase (flavoprotein) [Saccharopolyspora flava]